MQVQFSNTPYAHLLRPGPDEALSRARAALKDMAAKGSVRRSSVGLRLGKLGIRYSSTSLSFGGQEPQASAQAPGDPQSAGQAAARIPARDAAQARTAGQRPEGGDPAAQARTFEQATQAAQFANAGARPQAVHVPSLFARARQRMTGALLSQPASSARPGQDSLDSLLRNRRGQACYAECLHPSPTPGGILSRAV